MSEYVHTAEVHILLHVRNDEYDGDEPAPCTHVPLKAVFSNPDEMYAALHAIMEEMDPVLRGGGNGQDGDRASVSGDD